MLISTCLPNMNAPMCNVDLCRFLTWSIRLFATARDVDANKASLSKKIVTVFGDAETDMMILV